MIYRCTTGLLLTTSATAGACHSNTILHFLPAPINTELFHFSTYYPYPCPSCFLRFLCCFKFPPFYYLSFFVIRDKLSTLRTSWRPSRPGTSTCWRWRPPTAASSNITSMTSRTSLMWVNKTPKPCNRSCFFFCFFYSVWPYLWFSPGSVSSH